jgi:hypothetical protein
MRNMNNMTTEAVVTPLKMFHSVKNSISTERCIDISQFYPSVRMDSTENQWEMRPLTTMVSLVEPFKEGMVLVPSHCMTWACGWSTTDLTVHDEEKELGQDLSVMLDDIVGVVAAEYVDRLVEESSDGERYTGWGAYNEMNNIDSDIDSRSVSDQESVFETFDDVSVLTEESNLWKNVDVDFGMEDDQFNDALEQGTIFEHVLAALKWDKSEKSSLPSGDYMVLDFRD